MSKTIRENVKVAINVAMNIFLLIVYFKFFGQHFVGKYFDQAVINSKDEELQATIPPPGDP